MDSRVNKQSDGVVMATVTDDDFGTKTTNRSADVMAHRSHSASSGADGPSLQAAPLGADPVETYFACITTCSLDDGDCITICTEQLRQSP